MIVKYSEQNYAAVYMQPGLNLILVLNIIIVLDLYLNSKGAKYTHPSMSLALKKDMFSDINSIFICIEIPMKYITSTLKNNL